MVEQLVRDFVPQAMAAGVDFAGVDRVSAKFHHTGSGLRREGDVIWRLPTRDGESIYLYLLLEFQSRPDRWMAVRSLIYQGLLWQDIVAGDGARTDGRLPPVLTVVLYNGARPWSVATNVTSLIALPADSSLWSWQPRACYHLLDMGRFPGSELARRDTLAALLFQLEQPQNPVELAALITTVIGWFRSHPSYGDLRRLFAELVGQAMAGVGIVDSVPTDLQEMQTMLATLGEEWRRQWREEGLAEGRAAGQAHLLTRLLVRRFGSLPTAAQQRIAAASLDQLDQWADRVLDAPTLDAVLGPLPQ